MIPGSLNRRCLRVVQSGGGEGCGEEGCPLRSCEIGSVSRIRALLALILLNFDKITGTLVHNGKVGPGDPEVPSSLALCGSGLSLCGKTTCPVSSVNSVFLDSLIAFFLAEFSVRKLK